LIAATCSSVAIVARLLTTATFHFRLRRPPTNLRADCIPHQALTQLLLNVSSQTNFFD